MKYLSESVISGNRRKAILFLIVGISIGLAAGFILTQSQQISKQKASQKLVSTLESQSNQELEVVNTKSENGMYRIDISDSQNQLSTYYMTKNGEMISSQVKNLDNIKQTIAAQKSLVSCLEDRNAVLYGNASQQTSIAQVRLLGGSSIVSPVYKDVRSPEVLQEAVQREVQRVPSIYYEGSSLSGINSIEKIGEFAGC